jgi:hypothetical protein
MLHRISGHRGPRLQEPCSCARAHPVRNACAAHAQCVRSPCAMRAQPMRIPCAFRAHSCAVVGKKRARLTPPLPTWERLQGARGRSPRPPDGRPTSTPRPVDGLSPSCPRAVPEPVSPSESGDTPYHSFKQSKRHVRSQCPAAADRSLTVAARLPSPRYSVTSGSRLGFGGECKVESVKRKGALRSRSSRR